MLSEARLRANRLNAQKSTGPRTAIGKARSRRNAVQHGFCSRGAVISRTVTREIERRRAEWHAFYTPRDVPEGTLIDEMVRAAVQIEHADRWQLAQRRRLQRAARRDFDRAARRQTERLIAELPHDPGPVVLRLQHSVQGCAWMIERWNELAAALDQPSTWTESSLRMAVQLLGIAPCDAHLSRKAARWLRWHERTAASPDLSERDRLELLSAIGCELERLQAFKDEVLDPLDAADRLEAPARCDLASSPAGAAWLRWRAKHARAFDHACREFQAMRSASAARNEPTKNNVDLVFQQGFADKHQADAKARQNAAPQPRHATQSAPCDPQRNTPQRKPRGVRNEPNPNSTQATVEHRVSEKTPDIPTRNLTTFDRQTASFLVSWGRCASVAAVVLAMCWATADNDHRESGSSEHRNHFGRIPTADASSLADPQPARLRWLGGSGRTSGPAPFSVRAEVLRVIVSRVVLAMSGGVDSSVAAHLLKRQGHEVIGLFMRTGAHIEEVERRAKTCCSAIDAIDAQNVADRLDIPFYALDFERDFDRIMDHFADEYLAGRTPNPCVMCNIWLKFGKLWAYGKQVGADFVATGHHARIVGGPDGSPRVARAIDRGKDQSYVLFGLRRELLPHVLLPVGMFPKDQIRGIARDLGLPVHDKSDSQEICFVPDDDYLGFVRRRRPEHEASGTIVDGTGQVLGRHSGVEAFTVGQRRGLGLAVGQPRYVVRIEPSDQTVTVGPRESLDRPGLEAARFNWQIEVPTGPIACHAQIRAQHHAVPARAEPLPGDRARVWFETPQPAVAPGQVVTLYDGDLVLGGGWIDRSLAAE